MEPEATLLTADKPIPGQKWCLLSFVSPEDILKNKDVYMFNEFLKDFEFEFKSKNLEQYLAKNVLDFNTQLESKAVEFEKLDLSGCADLCRNSKLQVDTFLNNLHDFTKKNKNDLNEDKLKESFDTFKENNERKLESDFYVLNKFRTSVRGLKIRGVFEYPEECETFARKLSKEDNVHNILMGEVGKWIPWDPNVNHIKDQEYADDQLNTLMKMKQKNEEERAAFFRDKNLQRPEKPKFSVYKDDESPPENTMFDSGDLALERKMRKL